MNGSESAGYDALLRRVGQLEKLVAVLGGCVVIGDGVMFESERFARIYCDKHEKDLVHVPGSGWLAKNRST